MRAPEFWRKRSGLAALLAPFGDIYAMAGAVRQRCTTPWRSPVPIICIGNLVAGGAGKTPVAIATGAMLRELGKSVHFLSRGYGGSLPGPVQVDPSVHTAQQVGDEPLLLARIAPTWVARNRVTGVKAAISDGADIIVMDDGFQNPSVSKTLSLIVVDGGYGFGNERVMPAGPLREPLPRGLARADAVVLMGADVTNAAHAVRRTAPDTPIMAARLATLRAAQRYVGAKVLAFAGIGRPDKFFQTLKDLGCVLVAHHPFPDHYDYTPDDIALLVEAAAKENAVLVTTAKDFQRVPEDAQPMVEVLDVVVEWRDPDAVNALLSAAAQP
jgi:tetraacyldisaccharide 4'-kinase